VIEDNGGGLALYVFDTDDCIWSHTGYEDSVGMLTDDIEALIAGDDPRISWADNDEDPQAAYEQITSYEFGFKNVAHITLKPVSIKLYCGHMGAAATREFNIFIRKFGLTNAAGEQNISVDDLRDALAYEWHRSYAWAVNL